MRVQLFRLSNFCIGNVELALSHCGTRVVQQLVGLRGGGLAIVTQTGSTEQIW